MSWLLLLKLLIKLSMTWNLQDIVCCGLFVIIVTHLAMFFFYFVIVSFYFQLKYIYLYMYIPKQCRVLKIRETTTATTISTVQAVWVWCLALKIEATTWAISDLYHCLCLFANYNRKIVGLIVEFYFNCLSRLVCSSLMQVKAVGNTEKIIQSQVTQYNNIYL